MAEAEKLGLLILTFGLAFTISAYEGYADAKGWPVGTMYRDRTSFLSILAFLAEFGAPIVALVVLPWWMAIVVVVGGFFTGLLLVRTLRSRSQIVAPVGLVVCWVANILYVLP